MGNISAWQLRHSDVINMLRWYQVIPVNNDTDLMAVYLGQPGWTGTRTLRSIKLPSLASQSTSSLGFNTRENPGTLLKHEQPDDKNLQVVLLKIETKNISS